MKFEPSTLSSAIRHVVLSASLLSPGIALAEEPTDEKKKVERLEKIKVTGSPSAGY